MALTGTEAGRLARIIALGLPLALLAAVYVAQYGFGLEPCEMCWWQRYAHFAALTLALLALVRPSMTALVRLAGLAILVGGLIGAYHAGVEYGWWKGMTACTSGVSFDGGSALDSIMNAPMIPCDVVQWSLFGISFAGWNFLVSVPAALLGFALLRRSGSARG